MKRTLVFIARWQQCQRLKDMHSSAPVSFRPTISHAVQQILEAKQLCTRPFRQRRA